MVRFVRKATLLGALLTLSVGLNSCSKQDSNTDSPTPAESSYALWLQVGSWPNTFQYVVGTSSLSSGTVSLQGNGVEVTGKADYGIIPHKGYYYYPSTSSGNGRFSKFALENNQMTVVKEVPFTYQTGVTSYTWADDNTLILLGTNGEGTKVLYSIVNATTLEIKNGELALPAVPTGAKYMATGSFDYVNGKLFVGLAYLNDWPAPGLKKVAVAVVDYPSMNFSKLLQDDRTLGTGGINMWEPGSFVDTNGDFYHLADPGWLGTGLNLPSVLYKVKSGTTEFDASYTFDLSTLVGGPAGAIWNIGNGKAIIKYEDKSIAASGSTSKNVYGFAVLDLVTKTVTKLTAIPFDNSDTLESVVIENGKAYILSNAETGKDYVWEYDPATGKATPGLEIQGGYDYMLRIDKLK